ncbi:hypothetical protein OG216_37685 [Streptomycetaceae bacterium NBC_01309]
MSENASSHTTNIGTSTGITQTGSGKIETATVVHGNAPVDGPTPEELNQALRELHAVVGRLVDAGAVEPDGSAILDEEAVDEELRQAPVTRSIVERFGTAVLTAAGAVAAEILRRLLPI